LQHFLNELHGRDFISVVIEFQTAVTVFQAVGIELSWLNIRRIWQISQ